jgi:GTP-binding protein Era
MEKSNNSQNKIVSTNVTSLLNPLLETIPENSKQNIRALMNSLPKNKNQWDTLIQLASDQLKITFGQKKNLVIIGPTNVGKSTLFNQLLIDKKNSAEVGPLPGTTKMNQNADAGLFEIIDTPGTDAVGISGDNELNEALEAAYAADYLIIVFDAIQGIKRYEKELFNQLIGLNKPYSIILNKIDLVRKDEERVIQKAAQNLGILKSEIIPISAKRGDNLNLLLKNITLSVPEMTAALGQTLPKYRALLSNRTILSAASLSAVIALTPLPIIDFVPLLSTQTMMVLGIARIYDYKINLQRAKELITTFGIGYLGRTIFYELSKLGGIPGWALSVAIAASTTIALGYASVLWFDRGEKLSADMLSKITKQFTAFIIDNLKSLGKKSPDKKSLKNFIADILSKKIEEDRDEIILASAPIIELPDEEEVL